MTGVITPAIPPDVLMTLKTVAEYLPPMSVDVPQTVG